MKRRQACIALGGFIAGSHTEARLPGSTASAAAIAARYVAAPTPHYVNALLISAQRSLGLRDLANQATTALREAIGTPGHAFPGDWPRLAGYAALGRDPLIVQALESALIDTAAGPRLMGLRPWTDDLFLATLLVDSSLPLLPDHDRATAALAAALLDLSARLQRPDGLFDHAEGSPVAWGRGNGFASLALAQALAGPLRASSAAAPLRARLQAHLQALLPLQGPEGLWRQVLDRPESRLELTATAMSLASLALAGRHGWLPAGAADAAIRRAWTGVLSRIDGNAGFRDVCAGTPAGPTLDFYLHRPMVNGRDERAAAMVLLAAISNGA